MIRIASCLFFLIFLLSCSNDSEIPRPKGYFRIDLPVQGFESVQTNCPFSFEKPKAAVLSSDSAMQGEVCYSNIEYPALKAKLHLSYRRVQNDIEQLLGDSRSLAYKHSIRATAINEQVVQRPEASVYGVVYHISGNAASSLQFHITDSVKHFLRGSLYFFAEPNADSTAPVLQRIRSDVEHIIESMAWKN